jgi:hypothetical protein
MRKRGVLLAACLTMVVLGAGLPGSEAIPAFKHVTVGRGVMFGQYLPANNYHPTEVILAAQGNEKTGSGLVSLRQADGLFPPKVLKVKCYAAFPYTNGHLLLGRTAKNWLFVIDDRTRGSDYGFVEGPGIRNYGGVCGGGAKSSYWEANAALIASSLDYPEFKVKGSFNTKP